MRHRNCAVGCYQAVLAFGLLLGLSALPIAAQIRGGEEAASFTPGDHVILDEDYTSIPLGGQVPNWQILQGSYEVAEFQKHRWLRPLTAMTLLVRRVQFPRDFSLEFTVYLFAEGGPYLEARLLTEKDLEEAGGSGPAQLILRILREFDFDSISASVRDVEKRVMREFVRGSDHRFPPNQLHRVALSVRNGQLHLYFDGKRVGVVLFQPQEPLVGISLFFYSTYQHDKPYKDRPALFTNLRLAAYSTPQAPRYTGVLLYLLTPPGAKDKLSQPRGEKPSVLEELQKRFGWQEANAIQVRTSEDSTTLTAVLRIPLPVLPFKEGDTSVRMGQEGEAFIKSLQEALEIVRQQVPNAALLIVGQVLEGEGVTEREREFLRRLRMLAFASWFAEHGLGDPKTLCSISTSVSGYEGVLIHLNDGRYEGTSSIQ